MKLLDAQHFHLVGIKGVAMAGMAQMLVDAGKDITGSDVAENFVTEKVLNQLNIPISDLNEPLPNRTECVIYTAAHGGSEQTQVTAAIEQNVATFSHAAGLAELFNQKKGIAVCGVGGKSTISAMIAWILEQTGHRNSYAVGVGEIIGLQRSAHWRPGADWMVVEADEYVTNPNQAQRGEEMIPRFSYLQPALTVCSHIMFDHPDVYKDEAHTHEVFSKFFSQIKPGGKLIIHQSAAMLGLPSSADQQLTYGSLPTCTAMINPTDHNGDYGSAGELVIDGQTYQLNLLLPGSYNLENAAAAILATREVGVNIDDAVEAISNFRSTSRRFEFVGEKSGVLYYDDYAHHPMEISAVLKALRESFSNKRVVVAFQPHTYSRTQELFSEFVVTLANAPELILLDIFASAREQVGNVSSDQLVAAIKKQNPQLSVKNLNTVENLATYCKEQLQAGNLMITLGAGDIYQVHDLI